MLVDWIMMKPVFFLLPLFILSYITSRFFGKSVCFICHSNETFLFYSPGISLRPRLTVIHLTWLRDRRMILVWHIDFFSCLDFIFFLRCSYLSMFSIMVTANLWLLSRCPLHCHRLSQIWKLGAFPPPAAHRPNPYLLANLFILHRWLESSSWVTLKNSEKKKQFGNGFFLLAIFHCVYFSLTIVSYIPNDRIQTTFPKYLVHFSSFPLNTLLHVFRSFSVLFK